ncbi:hypothetical protein [[Phormidium ambiguum] IAM M-71]|nr:hypothetical protein [Phormidium ambiguum]
MQILGNRERSHFHNFSNKKCDRFFTYLTNSGSDRHFLTALTTSFH